MALSLQSNGSMEPLSTVSKDSSLTTSQQSHDSSTDKLWLLSMTADQASTTNTVGREGYLTPPTTDGQSVKVQQSPLTKNTMSMDAEEWKKARRREQCRINQANYRKRQRQFEQAGSLKLSSTMNAEQQVALAMALEACGYAAQVRTKRKPMPQSLPPMAPQTGGEEQRRERRREQCRINQANFRKRQREDDPQPIDKLNVLQHQIQQLQARKAAAIQRLQTRIDPVQLIGDFYHSLGLDITQLRLPNTQAYQQMYGYSPALQLLLDIQREEFDSMASLKLHWSWYRTQFRVFQFSVSSFERFEAGEHVIIKVKGMLRLDISCDGNKGGGKRSGYGEIVCPVLHQFEFERGDQAVTRITSEVDLITGVMGSLSHGGIERALSGLHCLSEGFSISNRIM
ncbi:hypothetical protein PHYBOEH_010992 [Phytophthora boehmeriae]|uniref:BZIP domain-containing protein n=1 Tax=Phytophthora boehmeriae TaxID=109152 RepID=A0A8T1VPM8_9STRA|nr:hypothetical protein PHYBOEH_010992 [Phytophthora boehmeriae]